MDIPLVRRQTLIDLHDAFKQGNAGICYPTFLEVRGHPPLISGIYVKALKTGTGQGGLREFLNGHKTDAMNVPVVDRYILKDIDTPEDYVWAWAAWIATTSLPMTNAGHSSFGRVYHKTLLTIAGQLQIWPGHGNGAERGRLPAGYEMVVSAAQVHDLAKSCSPRHAADGARHPSEDGISPALPILSRFTWIIRSKKGPITESEVVFLADKWIQEGSKSQHGGAFSGKTEEIWL